MAVTDQHSQMASRYPCLVATHAQQGRGLQNKRQVVGGGTAIAVAFAMIVSGTLFAGRQYVSEQLTRDAAPAMSVCNAANSANSSTALKGDEIYKTPSQSEMAQSRKAPATDAVITLKSGHTLSQVSMRYLRRFSPRVTQEIQTLNPKIKDPDRITARTHVDLPAPPVDSDVRTISSGGVTSGTERLP